MTHAKIRELRLVAQGLGSAITADPKFFIPIQAYGRQLLAFNPEALTKERLEDLGVAADRIETFFDKYRRTPDSGFYITPSQIDGSDDDLHRLRTLI